MEETNTTLKCILYDFCWLRNLRKSWQSWISCGIFPTLSQNRDSESSEVLSIRVFAWFVLSCLLVFYDLNFLNALMLCRVIFTSPVFVCTVPGAHHRWWAPDGAKLRYYAYPGLPPVPLVCLSTKWAVVPENYFHTSLEKLKIIPHSMLSLGPHKLI